MKTKPQNKIGGQSLNTKYENKATIKNLWIIIIIIIIIILNTYIALFL